MFNNMNHLGNAGLMSYDYIHQKGNKTKPMTPKCCGVCGATGTLRQLVQDGTATVESSIACFCFANILSMEYSDPTPQ
jgi:hypothetical protein